MKAMRITFLVVGILVVLAGAGLIAYSWQVSAGTRVVEGMVDEHTLSGPQEGEVIGVRGLLRVVMFPPGDTVGQGLAIDGSTPQVGDRVFAYARSWDEQYPDLFLVSTEDGLAAMGRPQLVGGVAAMAAGLIVSAAAIRALRRRRPAPAPSSAQGAPASRPVMVAESGTDTAPLVVTPEPPPAR